MADVSLRIGPALMNRYHHLVANRPERLPDHLLTEERAVDLCDIKERDASVIARPHDPDCLLPVDRWAIHPGEVLAAEAQGGAPLQGRGVVRTLGKSLRMKKVAMLHAL